MEPKRAFIYGSCVTRDGVDLWPEYGLELAGYIARQSLISAYAPADPHHFKTGSIPSSFQRRMAEGDIRGNLRTALADQADRLDALIWDLTDERLGVILVPSGGVVTRVVRYDRGIYVGPGRLDKRMALGESQHLEMWGRALDHFLCDLEALGLRSRTIVNATPWSESFADGAPTGGDPSAAEFNTALAPYLELVRARGLRVATPEPASVRAEPDHKWGPAPFHYTTTSYRAALEQIRYEVVRSSAGLGAPRDPG